MTKNGIGNRGVTVGDNFSPKQRKAIKLFGTGELRCKEIANEVGVNATTISMWRRNYQFLDACILDAKEQLKNSLPELYKTGLSEAKKGSAAHLKILLEHIDKLEDRKTEVKGSLTFKWKSN